MKRISKPLLGSAEFEQFVERGGGKVTPATVHRLAALLPELRDRFAAVHAPGFPKGPAQLDFLARVVDAVAAESYRDLSYAAIGEAAFALLYLARDVDIIPDCVEGLGYLDDAAVAAAVIARNAAEFATFAPHADYDFAAIGPAKARRPSVARLARRDPAVVGKRRIP